MIEQWWRAAVSECEALGFTVLSDVYHREFFGSRVASLKRQGVIRLLWDGREDALLGEVLTAGDMTRPESLDNEWKTIVDWTRREGGKLPTPAEFVSTLSEAEATSAPPEPGEVRNLALSNADGRPVGMVTFLDGSIDEASEALLVFRSDVAETLGASSLWLRSWMNMEPVAVEGSQNGPLVFSLRESGHQLVFQRIGIGSWRLELATGEVVATVL